MKWQHLGRSSYLDAVGVRCEQTDGTSHVSNSRHGSESEHHVYLLIQVGIRLHCDEERQSSLRVSDVSKRLLARQLEDVAQVGWHVIVSDLIEARVVLICFIFRFSEKSKFDLREVPELRSIVVRAEGCVIAAVRVASDGSKPNIITSISQQVA